MGTIVLYDLRGVSESDLSKKENNIANYRTVFNALKVNHTQTADVFVELKDRDNMLGTAES